MAFYKGKNFRVKIDTKTLMHEIDFEFGGAKDFEDLASKDVNQDFHPGKKNYNLSGNGYINNSDGDAQQDFDALWSWFDDDSIKAYEIGDGETGHIMFGGDAFMSEINFSSVNDEVLKYSFTLKVKNSTKSTTA